MTQKNPQKIELISDSEIESIEEDLLKCDDSLNILTSIALWTEWPFTVWVQWKWWSGKTSMLKMVEKNLQDEENIVTVWFNAWQYEREDHIIFPFIATIHASIEEKINNNEKLKKIWTETLWFFSTLFRSIAYATSFDYKLVKFSWKDAIDRIENIEEEREKNSFEWFFSQYLDYKKAFDSLKIPKWNKIIVFIDDLDRCNPKNAITILEAIKLILNQRWFLFFLWISEDVLEWYLEDLYVNQYKISKEDFRQQRYLDKIIQLPFLILPHNKNYESFIEKLKDKNKSFKEIINSFGEFEDIKDLLMNFTDYNPRKVKRLINTLIVNYYLSKEIEGIKVSFIFFWQLLRENYPKIFRYLIRNPYFEYFRNKLNNGEKKDESQLRLDEQITKNIDDIFIDETFRKLFNTTIWIKWVEDDENRKKSYFFTGVTISELEKLFDEAYSDNKKWNYKNAEKKYKKLLEIATNNVSALWNYAILLEKLWRNEEAEEYYKKALGIEPNNANKLWNYASLLDDLWRNQEAEEYYKKSLGIEPNNANSLWNYANLLFWLKRDSEAWEYWEKSFGLLDKEKESPLLLELYFYRFCYEKNLSERQKVKTHIENLLKEWVKSPWWDFSRHIARTEEEKHPEIEQIKSFAEQISKV